MFTAVFTDVFATGVVELFETDVAVASPVGVPPLPLGLEDCDEHPATHHGPATESSNTDGKNDFIRLSRSTHARLYASLQDSHRIAARSAHMPLVIVPLAPCP